MNKLPHRAEVARSPTSRSALGIAIASILSGGAYSHDVYADAADNLLEEVVVTARKRTEHLQDVPQNIDVFATQDLQNLGVANIEDYMLLSSSLSLVEIGPGNQRFFIRGASDGSGPVFGTSRISTTGYLVDDLSLSFYGHIPDMHLYDIERIEVLNGPQGTLFGPGAMSGAVRIVTHKPDPSAFSAGVDFDGGKIDGGGANRTYEAFVNIPLIDGQAALRMSAFDVKDGGYIDNVFGTRHWLNGTTSTNAPWSGNDFNTRHETGARLAIQENFNEDWNATLTGFYQRQRYAGEWEDEPAREGDYKTQLFSPQGGYEYDHMLELRVEGDVGIGDLIYVGGYSDATRRTLYDFSDYAQYTGYAPLIQGSTCQTSPLPSGTGQFGGCKVPYMYGKVSGVVSRWSNELRLQSKPGGRFHWTVGGYWEKTEDPYSGFEILPNVNFSGAQAQYIIGHYHSVAKPLAQEFYSDFATFDYLLTTQFADLTYDLDNRWSVEAGVNHFHGKTSELTDWESYYWQQKVAVLRTSSYQKTTAKAAVNFKAAEHALVYLSFAQGARDGGFNYVNSNSPYPAQFNPDTLSNYEFGLKTAWLGGRVVWNSALYYMPWKDYQITIPIQQFPFAYSANIGNVRIYGLESSLEMRPLAGLQLSFSGNYNDSKLVRENYTGQLQEVPGERVPEAPYFNFSAMARYEQPISAALNAFTQFDLGHKGDMYNELQVNERTLQPSYTLGNLRFGVDHPDGHWQAEGYVTNLWNARAVLYANPTSVLPEVAPSEPRVFGMRLKYRWGKIS